MAVVPISPRQYTTLRVIATAVPIIIAVGATAAVFLAVPAANDAIRQAFRPGGAAFIWLVLLPAFLMAVATTVFAVRILWSASEPPNSDGDTT